MDAETAYGCRTCATAGSVKGEARRMPPTCPTLTHAPLARGVGSYLGTERRALMKAADEAPFAEDGRLRSRVEELAYFARRTGVRRIGIAFCMSMRKEAQRLADTLEAEGLQTALVCCRVGAIDQGEIGLPKANPGRFVSTCNPVAQARLLDEAKVELVAAVGLCMGHDLVLQQESSAPVTTLVVKDRVHDHSPIRALRDGERTARVAGPEEGAAATSAPAGAAGSAPASKALARAASVGA